MNPNQIHPPTGQQMSVRHQQLHQVHVSQVIQCLHRKVLLGRKEGGRRGKKKEEKKERRTEEEIIKKKQKDDRKRRREDSEENQNPHIKSVLGDVKINKQRKDH